MNEDKAHIIRKFYWLIVLVIAIWITSWIITDNLYQNVEDRGAFGDKFGFINSLFSGLALAGIIYSIFLQQKELSLQRTELKETKENHIIESIMRILLAEGFLIIQSINC